jgi:hypothetical protein
MGLNETKWQPKKTKQNGGEPMNRGHHPVVKGPKAGWKLVGSLDVDAEPAPAVLGLGEPPHCPWSAAVGMSGGGPGRRARAAADLGGGHGGATAKQWAWAAEHLVAGEGEPGGGRRWRAAAN